MKNRHVAEAEDEVRVNSKDEVNVASEDIVTMITFIPMSLWPLNDLHSLILPIILRTSKSVRTIH